MTIGFVLDASTTLSWAFDDENDDYADAVLGVLADGFAIVPALWPLEVGNGLVIALRRSRVSQEEVEAFLSDLSTLDIRTEHTTSDVGQALALALESGLTTYDAAYLALARELSIPLATNDTRMRQSAAHAGVSLLAA